MKKYEILKDEASYVYGLEVYRIRALKDIEGTKVKAGDKGGFVRSEQNLSQEGNCWIFDNAMAMSGSIVSENACLFNNVVVMDFAKVKDEAVVSDGAHIMNHAEISGNARVYGNANVSGHAIVTGDVIVSGSAIVREKAIIKDCASVSGSSTVLAQAVIGGYASVAGTARVAGNTKVSDYSFIGGDASVFGNSEISGCVIVRDSVKVRDAHISGDISLCGTIKVLTKCSITSNDDIFSISNIGSRYDTTTFYKGERDIMVTTGCFVGSIDDFKEQVLEVHEDSIYAKAYLMGIDFAKFRLSQEYKDNSRILPL